MDFKNIGYYTLVSIPVAFTIFGLVYMIQTNCKIRERCCKCCSDLEKEDKNLDYGAYYYNDGQRRQGVVEVTFKICFLLFMGWVRELGEGDATSLLNSDILKIKKNITVGG